MRKIIVICGPTASGKTDVAAQLCKLINGEIISADSRQVYKYLDIGTNKSGKYDPATKLRIYENIPQHLTDLIEPSEKYSAGEFKADAERLIKTLQKRGKKPVIAGGTGLYIKALIDGIAPLPAADETLRAGLKSELEKNGLAYLEKKLKSFDPESAEKNKGNPQRIIRAIEVFELTGIPITEHHKKTKKSNFEFRMIGLMTQKNILHERIEKRTAEMLENGMVEETRGALEKGSDRNSPGMQSLGYTQVIDFIDNKIDKKELENSINAATRQYAKRQMTWFRADKRIKWLDMGALSDPAEIAKSISNML
ncbi:MAG: tRNA (adenosine(37)-N6)-dimethylallyltransferase MiaA [Endomicrobiales bacterium]|nr:tRNA (adenosine(37)-N6)-dimethylallyltransferase MiaA [Endomicrobiales bacterium]